MKYVRYRLIHLSQCRGITRRILRSFLHVYPTLAEIYQLSPTDISQRFSIPLNRANLITSELQNSDIKEQIKKNLRTYPIITIVDENYPPMLNTIKDAPLVLYASGDISLLKEKQAISVVGTRHPSREAWDKIHYFLKPLITDGWLIVSGMAKGIDGYAHQVALNNNGKTIAVLGSGFHSIYPKQHISLFHEIVKKGLVLSEYPPDVQAKKYHFPERNRIISGLTFGTLVVEAKERSGTLITVDQALDQGREVFAIPGSPLVPQSKGCHQMIQDGAKLVHHPNDILEEWKALPISFS